MSGGAPGESEGDDAVERLAAIADDLERLVQGAVGPRELDALRRRAIVNRRVAVAVGVLMVRCHTSPTDAFVLLVAACRQTGRRLSEVAAELAATGTVTGAAALVGRRAEPSGQD